MPFVSGPTRLSFAPRRCSTYPLQAFIALLLTFGVARQARRHLLRQANAPVSNLAGCRGERTRTVREVESDDCLPRPRSPR